MIHIVLIISPNEVFADIMALASPPPPVDPDDEKYSTGLFQICVEGRYPLRYVVIEI